MNRPVHRIVIVAICAGCVLSTSANFGRADQPAEQRHARLLPLRLIGTQIQNSRRQRVRLRGVNAASLEWTSDGEGHILKSVNTAIQDWHVNIIRLPLSQDRWFGKAPDQKDDGAPYRALVKQVVDACASQECYIILDLHWSDAGEWGKQVGQHVMPDQNSVAFWKECAAAYKNKPAVLFDLYNEPHNVTWEVWLNGGMVSERPQRGGGEKSYQSVGMQALLDTIRGTGARNLVVVGGLDWAYDMSGFLSGKQLVDKRGNGVIYANHTYPFKGDTVEKWIGKMEAASKSLPIIVSEFGQGGQRNRPVDPAWIHQTLDAMRSHDWDWIAWDFHPSAGPTLISDWNYTPTPNFGVFVKQELETASSTGSSRDTHLSTQSRRRRQTEDDSSYALTGIEFRTTTTGSPNPFALFKDASMPIGQFDSQQDVGTVLHQGTATFDSASAAYTVSGSGENMWSTADAFHYVWKRASGDLTIASDVAFVGKGKEPHRKACLLIRQSLDADSAYVDAALHGDGLTSLQFRSANGVTTHEVQSNVSAPAKLRLEKRGKTVRLYVAGKGEDLHFSGAAAQITFHEPFYVGIGVCSHNKDNVESAVFRNVELNSDLPAATGQPVLYSTLETQTIASTDRRVTHVTRSHIEAPNWLPDGKNLLFNSGGLLYRIPAAGGPPEKIDTGIADRCNNDHGISPDGTQIVISDQSQGQHQSLIYTLPIAGGTPKLVTPTGPSYWHGWSPDGKTLAFCGQRNGEFDIYSIPAEGGPETRLTTAAGLDDGPEYSPDGRTIYFNSERTGKMQIWRMHADGSEQEQVTTDELNSWFPHPSPDGKSLVFLSYESDVKGHPPNKDVTLRIMSLATRKIDVLGRFFGGQGTVNVPCWSPDSRKIAFVTYQLIP